MRILLTGGTGQLGRELRPVLSLLGTVAAPSRPELDLKNPDHVRSAVREFGPDVVVNAAAYTDVAGAEKESEAAAAVNTHGVGVVAAEARRADALLVHFSTDYVFAGEKNRPYRESDDPDPVNVYGKSKRDGERAVQDKGGPHLILRTSGLYSAWGDNVLRTLLRRLRSREEVPVVKDQVTGPTWARTVAQVTGQLVGRWRVRPGGPGGVPRTEEAALSGSPASDRWSGIYHVAAAGETSWYGFAREVRCAVTDHSADSPASDEKPLGTLRPIDTAELDPDVRRPRYSVLGGDRLEEVFGLRLPNWSDQLRWCLAEAYEGGDLLAGGDDGG